MTCEAMSACANRGWQVVVTSKFYGPLNVFAIGTSNDNGGVHIDAVISDPP